MAVFTQLIYYLFVFGKLAKYKPKQVENIAHKPFVSVIICAKNEGENLCKNLPFILSQVYNNFEVIVVDHCSDDDSIGYLNGLKMEYSNLSVVELDSSFRQYIGKKRPLIEGINAAKGEWVLLTDADCKPSSKLWVQGMVDSINNDTEIVLGYAPMNKKSTLLNGFVRFETFMTALQYFSYTLINKPYMGVGRNLMYKKHLFKGGEILSNSLDVSSGDDDLFVNATAKSNNTSICLNANAFVYSDAEKTIGSWFKQKRRHLATGFKYKWQHKVLLGLFMFSTLLFYIIASILLLFDCMFVAVIALIGMKFALQMFVFAKSMKRLKVSDMLLWVPLLDFTYSIYYFVMAPFVVLNKKTTWK